MSGPIPAPPSIGTADGSRIVVSGAPAAGQVLTADGPNAAHWAAAGGGGPAGSIKLYTAWGFAMSQVGGNVQATGGVWNDAITDFQGDTSWWAGGGPGWALPFTKPGYYQVSLGLDCAWPLARPTRPSELYVGLSRQTTEDHDDAATFVAADYAGTKISRTISFPIFYHLVADFPPTPTVRWVGTDLYSAINGYTATIVKLG